MSDLMNTENKAPIADPIQKALLDAFETMKKEMKKDMADNRKQIKKDMDVYQERVENDLTKMKEMLAQGTTNSS